MEWESARMGFFQRPNLRIDKNSEESAVLLLDVAGRNLNVFNLDVFADLDAALDCLTNSASLRLLEIQSAISSKASGGADIGSFAVIKDAKDAAASSEL